jgi:hypothetical protein
MRSKSEIEAFVRDWVARNVHLVPELTLPAEVDKWASDLTGDARAQGISGGDLNKTVGDIDDYLTGQHQQITTAAE